MKSTFVRITVSLVALMAASLGCRADAASYAQIIKERDNVLVQILADRESKRASGLAGDTAIEAAELALYSFRRDVALSKDEKIRNQERIVRVFERKLNRVTEKIRSGTAADIDVLEARASLLEAMQILEELRLPVTKD